MADQARKSEDLGERGRSDGGKWEGRRTNSVWRAFWSIEDDVPVMDVGLIYQADMNTSWRVGSDLSILLLNINILRASK